MKIWELPEYRYGIYRNFVAINYNPKGYLRNLSKDAKNQEG